MGWLVFVIYLGIIFYLGAIGGKRTKTLEDFTVAGRTLGAVGVGIATAATLNSAATFLGGPGWSYAWGYSALWYPVSLTALPWFGLFVISRMTKFVGDRTGALTVADYVGHRYNSDLLRVLVGLLCLFNIFYIAGQMAGSGIIMQSLLNIPYIWGVGFTTLIVVIYIAVGGAYADIFTDTFQGIIMAIVSLILFVTVYKVVGGFGALHANLAAQDPVLTQALNPSSALYASWLPVIGSLLYVPIAVTNPQFVNKLWAIKKGLDLRVFILVMCLVVAVNALVPVAGLFGRAIVGPGIAPDTIVPTLTVMLFHPAMSMILLVCIMAALMSTVDGMYIVIASVFSTDLYRKTIVRRGLWGTDKLTPQQVERTSLIISRVATALTGVVAFSMVMRPPSFLGNIIIIALLGLTSGLAGPVFVGAWWRRSTSEAALCSLIGGVAMFLVCMLGMGLNTYHAGLYGILFSIVVQIIVSLATQPMSDEYLRQIGFKYDVTYSAGAKDAVETK
jgi:sodium/pantothenate symporter